MILGLCGNANAGKDTIADFFVKSYGFAKVSMADPLKRICRDVYQFTDEQLWGPSRMRNEPDMRYERHHGPWVKGHCACCGVSELDASDPVFTCYLTPRFALQLLGTEWGRTCYPNTWVDMAIHTAHTLMMSGVARGVHYTYDPRVGLETWPLPQGPRITGVAIPDVRFRNEVDAINARGEGKVVRVTRPAVSLKEEQLAGASLHQSEQELLGIESSKFSVQFRNTMPNLQELEHAVRGLAILVGAADAEEK